MLTPVNRFQQGKVHFPPDHKPDQATLPEKVKDAGSLSVPLQQAEYQTSKSRNVYPTCL
jgi:hypothetical protein